MYKITFTVPKLLFNRGYSHFGATQKIDDFIDIGKKQKSKGILTICPTPIGNLHDWTMRQDKALFDADVIACEDTRLTGLLIKMLKEKNIRNELYENYNQTVSTQDENLQDEDDINVQDVVYSSVKDLEKNLPQLNDQFIEGEDIKLYKRKKIEDMMGRIQKTRKDQEAALNKLDPLNFIGKESQFDDDNEDFGSEADSELYGISSPFFTYLKNKIKLAKERKGRGILISCHKFNEAKRVHRLVALLKLGFNMTLVSDAGTPTISDPGFILVNKCIESGIEVISVPGPNVITLSLSLCGFPSDRYHFIGFPSKQNSQRDDSLMEAKKLGITTVLFESPLRISQLLLSIDKVYGENQQIWLGFELTKLFERKIRGPCRQIFEDITNPKVIKQSHLRGEVTVIIAPYTEQYNEDIKTKKILPQVDDESEDKDEDQAKQSLDTMVKKVEAMNLAQILATNFTESKDKELILVLMQILNISKTKAYQLIKQVKYQKDLDDKRQIIRKKLGIEVPS